MVTKQSTIVPIEELVKSSLENCEKTLTQKTKYPGIRFNITITDKEREVIDKLEDFAERRDFIAKKMKVREKLTLNHEGEDFLSDLNLFYNLLFVTGTEKMTEEAYQEVMKGSPGGSKDITDELLDGK